MAGVLVSIDARVPGDRTLVAIFLRGGADGLTLVPPVGDDDYHRNRPRMGVSEKEAVPLDGLFALHPSLGGLQAAYHDGALAVVHSAGSEDTTRSHFEAQDLMEHGGAVAGGWLGRFLRSRADPSASPLSAVAIGRGLPECLRGAPSVSVIDSIHDFALGDHDPGLPGSLRRLYEASPGPLGAAGRDTLAAVNRIEEVRRAPYRPAHDAAYGDDTFGRGLANTAQLIKAQVGLQAVSIDLGGWDSHFAQGTLLAPLLDRLGTNLSAFYRDLGPAMDTTSVVVMSEFGRRLHENASFGTDHGRGGVMFVMGGGVAGGRVVGDWPGLGDEVLEGPGDLPVLHNYRDVLAPVMLRHEPDLSLVDVFPGFDLNPLTL